MKFRSQLRVGPAPAALLLLSLWVGTSGAAQATPFTFEFDMPSWNSSSSPGLFGTSAIVDITVDNGAADDLNQSYLNSQITQVSVSVVGGTFTDTFTTALGTGGPSYLSTDGGGVATLDLLASATEPSSYTGDAADGFGLQFGIIGPQGGATTFALFSATDLAAAVPFVNGAFTGFELTSVAPVPEPASVGLMSLAFAAILFTRRRRLASVCSSRIV